MKKIFILFMSLNELYNYYREWPLNIICLGHYNTYFLKLFTNIKVLDKNWTKLCKTMMKKYSSDYYDH